MAGNIPIGRYFDDPDELFMWVNRAVMGIACINLANRAGVTVRLLQAPATPAQLAAEAQLPADKLARVLNYLHAHELIARAADGTYHATERTRMLQVAEGYFVNAETTATSAAQLLGGMRQDCSAFELQFGQPVFEYFAQRPERSALFASFMGFMTRRVTRFLFAQHRFQPFTSVADLGGSMGDLLLAVLQEYPGTRGILFDLPDTIALAAKALAAEPLAPRVELVAGNFFAAVPVAELYLLKQILHDWTDDECRTLLGCVRQAIPAQGRLVIIEHILHEVPVPDEGQGTDIAMMILATGRERRLTEFTALLRDSGFTIDRVSRNPGGHSVIEAVPV
jgi:hypothetical protein